MMFSGARQHQRLYWDRNCAAQGGTMINAMRTLTIIGALLFYLASVIAQPPAEDPIEIPFRLVENVVWLQVRVNNSRPLNFILDTAAATDAVNMRVAEELHLPLFAMRTRANVGAGDGLTRTAFAPNVQISLSDTNYENPRVGAVPLDSVSRSFGEPFDGALGYDLLSRWVVTIDYQQHKLVLHSNEAFEYKGSGRTIPLRPSFGVPIATGTSCSTARNIRATSSLTRPLVARSHWPRLSSQETVCWMSCAQAAGACLKPS